MFSYPSSFSSESPLRRSETDSFGVSDAQTVSEIKRTHHAGNAHHANPNPNPRWTMKSFKEITRESS